MAPGSGRLIMSGAVPLNSDRMPSARDAKSKVRMFFEELFEDV